MRLKVLPVLIVFFLLSVFVSPANAKTNPYWKKQCDAGVITWSVEGGRVKTVKRVMAWVDEQMPNYTFQQVPPYYDANIEIQMNAPQPKHHPRWLGVTYLWYGNPQIDKALVKIFIKKDKRAVYLVTLHEVFHAIGIPHYEKKVSLMNAYGLYDVWPIDYKLIKAQDSLCDL